MNHKSQRGFTLIELLVVIAIIGILASVVVASLNSARNKGNDAAIKANLANIRSQAELYYDGNNNQYASGAVSACDAASSVFTDPTVANAIAAANTASNGSATCNSSDGSDWAISVPLQEGGSWCVDSSGQSASGTAVSGSCS